MYEFAGFGVQRAVYGSVDRERCHGVHQPDCARSFTCNHSSAWWLPIHVRCSGCAEHGLYACVRLRSMAFTRASGHWRMGTAALHTPVVVGVRPSCSQIRLSNPIILRIPMRTLCHTRRSCMTPCLLVPLRECGLCMSSEEFVANGAGECMYSSLWRARVQFLKVYLVSSVFSTVSGVFWFPRLAQVNKIMAFFSRCWYARCYAITSTIFLGPCLRHNYILYNPAL